MAGPPIGAIGDPARSLHTMQESRLFVCLPVIMVSPLKSVSASSCRMAREGGGHNQQNTRFRAARSCGRGVLSVPDNPEAILTEIKPALLLKYNFDSRFWVLIDLSNPCQMSQIPARCRWLFSRRLMVLNRNAQVLEPSRFRRSGKERVPSPVQESLHISTT